MKEESGGLITMAGLTIWRVPGGTKQSEVIGLRLDDGTEGRVARQGARVLVTLGEEVTPWEFATVEMARRGFNEEVAKILETYAPRQFWTHTQAMMVSGLSKQGVNKVARMGRKRLGSRPNYAEGYRYTTEEVAKILRREVRNTPRLSLSFQPEEMRKALDDRGEGLNPTSRRVLELRYGLDGQGVRSLGEVAEEMKITRQGVSWSERKAIEWLFPGYGRG